MSLQIPCDHCGVRPVQEFVFGEIPRVPDAITDPDARDLDRGFMHENPEGPVLERWFHVHGCRRWVTVRRDTRNDEVLGGDDKGLCSAKPPPLDETPDPATL